MDTNSTVPSADNGRKSGLPSWRLHGPGRFFIILLVGAVVLSGLYFMSQENYLLFHSIAEGFAIIIAFTIFAVAWNSRRFMDNHYLLFIGIAYLFIGVLDFLHTLGYRGMGIFPDYGTNLATQLWIAARYLEALSLIVAPLFIHRTLSTNLAFLGYFLVTALLLVSIFYWDIFPAAFIEGSGLTTFKVASEYLISAMLLGAIWLLLRNRREFTPEVVRLMVSSLGVTIISEMTFTLYTDDYGIFNMIGHLLKVISFYLIYKALIETGLTRPYDLLFLNLKRSEEGLARQAAELAEINERLVKEVTIREEAEKLAQQSEREYHNLFSSMTEAFALQEIILDDSGSPCDYRFLETNDAFERSTGLSTVTGKTVKEVIPDIEPFWIDTYGRVALTGEPAHFERFSGPLGRWYEVYAYSPKSGYFVTLFTDITDRKKAEEALQRTNIELEASNRELEAFSYSVSHDLRAPLRSMEGFSQALIEDYGDKLDDEAKKYLGYIQESSELMAQLIDDLLNLSTITRDEMHIETVDISELAHSIANGLKQRERWIDVIIAEGMFGRGDRRLLGIALENLFSNAWKFTLKTPSPRVEMGVIREGITPVYFIKDNGVGFDMKYADKLFQPFQRLHKSTDFPGTGIGLATVQRIIRRHGGRVWAEGKAGQGATFYFTLE